MATQDDQDRTKTYMILTKGTMVGHYRMVEKIGAGLRGEMNEDLACDLDQDGVTKERR